jgi:predicted esterase
MHNVTRLILLLLLVSGLFLQQEAGAQSVLDPSDPVITYNSATPPTEPAYGQIGKWVRTKRLNWNTDSYKAYIYKGVQFRLKFPKTYNHTAVDNKRYPMLIFFHGLGETGTPYDNEYSLYHGGEIFKNKVDDGSFDGFVLALQSQGGWGPGQFDIAAEIAAYMVNNNKLNPFQISVNGLSAGGYASWDMMIKHPSVISSCLPMSGVGIAYRDFVNTYKFTPIWYFQGGLDGSPHPNTAEQVVTAINNAGGNLRYKLYPNLGHGVWNDTWGESDFFPTLNRAYASNPWTLFGRTEFCLGDPINLTIGVPPGYDQYEWRKDGNAIAGTGNSIQVTTIGVYTARVRKGSIWSDWSRVPVEIKIKAATVTPNITVETGWTGVIPALHNDSVLLKLPAGYQSYVWQRVGNTATLSTTNTLKTNTPGDYIARVTELYGCSSSFSAPFTVVNANGANKPSAAVNLTASTVSKTSLKLDWVDNPAPQYNETGYEVYQSLQSGTGYKLIAILPANSTTYTITGLKSNTRYYYKVRAINASAASAASNEATNTTDTDSQAPTAPGNLVITSSSRSSIALSWSPSTDDVGVVRYDIYVNGQRSYSTTTATTFNIQGLDRGVSYTFKVVAKDEAGNVSPFSNQVSGQPILNGLAYKHYTYVGDWQQLPDFSTLTPVATGVMPNVALTPRVQDDNFAFLWEGFLNVTVAGTYNFRTNSDDGSRLYLGTLNGTSSPYSFSATPLVNNDGLHGSQDATSANITLAVGVYPIAITFYEQGGGEAMTVSWRRGSASYATIPASAFTDAPTNNGSAPAAPSNLLATATAHNKISLTWTDNSNNETGFELWRSTNSATGFVIVGSTGDNTTSFVDSVNLAPNTTYYYEIRSIGQYGESALVDNLSSTDATWLFNNNYTDASGNGRTLTATGTPTFSTTEKREGTHAVNFNGTSQYVTLPTSGSFQQTAFSAKSVSFWMKSANNTGNRILLDLGGSDDGLALRLNSNTLIAGVANNSTRREFASTYNNTAWNHIALVYSTNTLRLYINGVLQPNSITNLPFTSVGSTSNASRIGANNSTNAFNILFGMANYSGLLDDFEIYSKALSQSDVTALYSGSQLPGSWATTLVAPAVPAVPTGLLATGNTPSTVQLTWNDVATNETGYQVYRSVNNNTNYILLTSLAANTNSYTDEGLFASSIYYYKVRATGVAGNSAFGTEDSAKTGNNLPLITSIENQNMHKLSTATVNISATDSDAGYVTLSLQNAPAFATLQQTASGVGTITFNPAGTEGVFNNITVIATDASNGQVSTAFALTVNDNYTPVISAIASQSVQEGQSLSINLSGSDQNAGDILSWTVSNLPDAFTVTPGANGSATLLLQPGYAASGTYDVLVKLTDGNGGVGTSTFSLTVADKDPNKKIYVRAKANNEAGAPWNNFAGPLTNNLKDENDVTTPVSVSFAPNWWWSTFTEGVNTGNNSGVYNDAVLQDYYFFGIFGGPETVDVTVGGLDPAKKYNLTFFSSTTWSGAPNNGTTTFKVGAETVSLAVQGNTTNTASINSLTPATNGTLLFQMGKAPGAPAGFLNSLVITEVFDDATAPAAPKFLAATFETGQGVKLNWTDVAYNEASYQVYRSQNPAGPFSLIGSASVNGTSYSDATVAGGQTYYYQVRSANTYGNSAYAGPVSVTTENILPLITTINNVVLKNNQSTTVNVVATDDATDNVTLTVTGLPSFATFVDNGNKTGTITIAPNAGSVGVFEGVVVKATDNSGGTDTKSFSITVVENNVSSVLINFSDGQNLPGRPWNNWITPPYAGYALNNLLNDENANSGINFALTDSWGWFANTGNRPNNGTEIYPSNVTRKSIFFEDANNHRMTVSGLNPAKKYNFVFFNSHDNGDNTVTNFAINSQTVTLSASYNSNKTVQINGIVPPANGQVVINVTKGAGARFGMLSTMIIQSYEPAQVSVLNPSDLRVIDQKRTSITLQWQDRADNETAYEIWRANAGSSSYSLVASIAANSTSYTNTGLPANTSYSYIVRAKNGTVNSAYSSPARGTTYQAIVNINFNTAAYAAPAPWNNLNSLPMVGMTWNNFVDEAGTPTSIGMVETGYWDGLYGAGMTTGNNSGPVPDKVMVESYGVFAGRTSDVKITGLNLSKSYDLTIFGSAIQGTIDATGAFTVNGKTVYMNAANNKLGTVTMYGVKPDENGEVLLSVAAYQTSELGLLGSLTIKGYDEPTGSVPQPPSSARGGDLITVADNAVQDKGTVAAPASTPKVDAELVAKNSVGAYPNPFDQNFSLLIKAVAADKVDVEIFDVSGARLITNRNLSVSGGTNNILVPQAQQLKAGMYVVVVRYASSKEQQTLRVIKR